MKSMIVFLTAAVFFLAGCVYESPLTEEHNIAVDTAVLGLWEYVQDEGDNAGENTKLDQMMILKFSDTEYLIHYRGNLDTGFGLYIRAYPVRIENIPCVQLQVIGSDEEPVPDKNTKELFMVFSYQLTNGILELKSLNENLVGRELKTTDNIRDAFLENKNNKELFHDPGKFRRIEHWK